VAAVAAAAAAAGVAAAAAAAAGGGRGRGAPAPGRGQDAAEVTGPSCPPLRDSTVGLSSCRRSDHGSAGGDVTSMSSLRDASTDAPMHYTKQYMRIQSARYECRYTRHIKT